MDSKNTFRKKAIIINSPNGFDAIEIKGCLECDHLKNITPECNCEKVACNIAPGRFRQWEWYDEIQAERPHFIFDDCPLFDWEDVRWHGIKEIPRDESIIAIKLKNVSPQAMGDKKYILGSYNHNWKCFSPYNVNLMKMTIPFDEKIARTWLIKWPRKYAVESWRYLEY